MSPLAVHIVASGRANLWGRVIHLALFVRREKTPITQRYRKRLGGPPEKNNFFLTGRNLRAVPRRKIPSLGSIVLRRFYATLIHFRVGNITSVSTTSTPAEPVTAVTIVLVLARLLRCKLIPSTIVKAESFPLNASFSPRETA